MEEKIENEENELLETLNKNIDPEIMEAIQLAISVLPKKETPPEYKISYIGTNNTY